MCLQEFAYRLKRGADHSSASVIQLAEGRAFTPEVAGSTPAGGTAGARSTTVVQAALNREAEGSNPSGRTMY